MMRSYVAPSNDTAPIWVRRYYPLPDPLATLEQAERWGHLDLPGRSEEGLRAELYRITLRLLYDDNPSPWLFERRELLRREMASRGDGPGEPRRSRTPPRPAETSRPTAPERADRQRPSWHPLSSDIPS